MNSFFKQNRKELRNISIITLIIIVLPYLPKLAGLVISPVGIIVSMALVGGLVLGMALKLYFRILVMRINNDNKTGL